MSLSLPAFTLELQGGKNPELDEEEMALLGPGNDPDQTLDDNVPTPPLPERVRRPQNG